MKYVLAGCLIVAVGTMICVFVMFFVFSSREPNVVTAKDACRYAYVYMPKDEITTLISSSFESNKYTAQQLADNGRCYAKEVRPGLWYAAGETEIPAMTSEKMKPWKYEAFLVVFNDPSTPAVKSFGEQILPCSFKVNGLVTTSKIADKKLCEHALDFIKAKSEYGI